MRTCDNIGIIVQARMGSRRLPGKVLCSLAGKPLLQYLLDRLRRCRTCTEIVVAVPSGKEDRPLVEFCHRFGVEVHAGPGDDVAGRFVEVLDRFGFDGFVRLCADSPLLDPQLVDWAVQAYLGRSVDLVTNLMPRSYPTGQSVEVLSTAIFREAYPRMNSLQQREHVTAYFYENRTRYSILNLAASSDHSDLKLAVDSAEDRCRLEEMILQFQRPQWTYGLDDVVDMSLAAVEASQDVA